MFQLNAQAWMSLMFSRGTLRNVRAGKSSSELKCVPEQRMLRSQMLAESIDDPVTSRSIVGRSDFPDFDMRDAMV